MAKKKQILRIVWGVVLTLFLIVAIMGVLIYKKIYTPNIFATKSSTQYLFIPTGTDFEVINKKGEETIPPHYKNIMINKNGTIWYQEDKLK